MICVEKDRRKHGFKNQTGPAGPTGSTVGWSRFWSCPVNWLGKRLNRNRTSWTSGPTSELDELVNSLRTRRFHFFFQCRFDVSPIFNLQPTPCSVKPPSHPFAPWHWLWAFLVATLAHHATHNCKSSSSCHNHPLCKVPLLVPWHRLWAFLAATTPCVSLTSQSFSQPTVNSSRVSPTPSSGSSWK